jgi:hypothetical protein
MGRIALREHNKKHSTLKKILITKVSTNSIYISTISHHIPAQSIMPANKTKTEERRSRGGELEVRRKKGTVLLVIWEKIETP